jgi:uncharacterized protein YegL
MRKSFLALPLVAAGFIFACGGTDRQGFATFTQPTDPADAAAEGGSGAAGFNVNEGDNLDGNEDGGCSTSSTTITRTPVVLEFVVDESGSMQGEKWNAQRDALLAAFEDMKKTADPAFFVGVQLFDDNPTTKVKPKPLTDPDHFDDLNTLIDKPSPHGGGTGTEDALTAGYHVVDTFKPPASAGLDSTNIKRVVVLMSDGAPTGGDTEKQACVDLADEEYTQQPPAGPVYTFSIGVGQFPSDNPDTYDPACMGRIAEKGGTAPAGCDPESTDLASTCHFQITPGGDTDATKDAFLAAITKIRALSASCEFKFTVTAGSDLSKLKVTMTGADGKVTTIKKDATNGWTFDDEKSPTKVILHGNACSASNGTVSGRVDVTAPCSGSK